jgi:hypothetical protein
MSTVSARPHFLLHSDLKDQKAFEVFEALDCDDSENADYFKEKCAEFPHAKLIMLRDKRFGNEGRTLLHNAARKGSLSAVLALIRMGHAVEPFDTCVSKVTPLMDAILAKSMEVAVVLIEAGANVFTTDVNGENSFHYAARGGSARILRGIISASKLNKDQIMYAASCLTIKKQLPEKLATSSMVKEILIGLRTYGHHPKIFRLGGGAVDNNSVHSISVM